jgi:hypothetical protein
MTQNFQFYDARAKESAAEAEVAVLDNVRERALRSEKTWRTLAEQARKVLAEREKAEAAKEVRRAALGDALSVSDDAFGSDCPAEGRSGAAKVKDALGRTLPPMPRERH